MIACREVRDALAVGPGEALGGEAQAHLAGCAACREHAAAHDRMIGALRTEPAQLDDVTRSRLLARMAPQLDAIAAGRARPRHARPWIAIVATATVAAGIAWFVARPSSPSSPSAPSAQPAPVVALEREQLQPYLISGPHADPAAVTLLAGRFSTLEVGAGEVVRATAGERELRIAAVGPARIDVERASRDEIALGAAGTLLVDARSTRAIAVNLGTVRLRAINATFAAQTSDAGTLVFIERGEIELGGTRLHAGDWYGPTEARSSVLVTMLRDHVHAAAPAVDRTGILAIDGTARATTESGAVLGTAPLWTRVPVGELVLVLAGPSERRVPVMVREAGITHVPVEPVAAVTPVEIPRPRSERQAIGEPPRPPREVEAPARAVDAGEPAVVAPPPPTASQLYATAEAALRVGDRALAESTWTQLVATFPDAPQAASALYDLANLARARGDRTRARAYLERLLASSASAGLREPALYASCRLHLESGDLAAATTCFQAFRGAFPESSHDGEVLAWLAGRAEESGGCAAARGLVDEYLQRYPKGPFATRARHCKEAP